MSVLGNAKSNRHRKPHEVEAGAASRKPWHLTWGDLCRESGRGVSRGRSSEEAGETLWSKGPKDHETSQSTHFRARARRNPKRIERCNCGNHSGGGQAESRWSLAGSATAETESGGGRRRKSEGEE
jgi:hypothetical protein